MPEITATLSCQPQRCILLGRKSGCAYMPLQGGDTGSKPSQGVSALTVNHQQLKHKLYTNKENTKKGLAAVHRHSLGFETPTISVSL